MEPYCASLEDQDSLFYFSEIAPVGVVGSFILDKMGEGISPFSFKQHYIGQAFDSEVLCYILNAIKSNRKIEFDYFPKEKESFHAEVFPLKIYSSTQNGRQYVMAWDEKEKAIFTYRLDRIKDIEVLNEGIAKAADIKKKFEGIREHIWGVSLGDNKLVHIEFVIGIADDEAYILNRLYREKRCGTVSKVERSKGLYSFSADVYDVKEMFPWIRTFLCRIVKLKISDEKMEELFWNNIDEMYRIYSIKEEQL